MLINYVGLRVILNLTGLFMIHIQLLMHVCVCVIGGGSPYSSLVAVSCLVGHRQVFTASATPRSCQMSSLQDIV